MPFAYVTVLPVNIIFRSTGRSNMGSISSFDQPLLTDKDVINTSSEIFPRTLTNVRFLEKIEFYKRKSVCKAIVFAALGLMYLKISTSIYDQFVSEPDIPTSITPGLMYHFKCSSLFHHCNFRDYYPSFIGAHETHISYF